MKEIGDWVASRADIDTAWTFVARIRLRCETLANFPERGQSHPEIGARYRSIPFERRATIFYVVQDEQVRIVRILYGGRDWALALGRPE